MLVKGYTLFYKKSIETLSEIWCTEWSLLSLLRNDAEWEGAKKRVVVYFKVRRNWRRRGISGHVTYLPSDAVRMMRENVFRMDRGEDYFSKCIISFLETRLREGEGGSDGPIIALRKVKSAHTTQINGWTIRGMNTVNVFTRACGILSTMDTYDTEAPEHWSRGFEPLWDTHVGVSSALSYVCRVFPIGRSLCKAVYQIYEALVLTRMSALP
jgi:hypothetical protein